VGDTLQVALLGEDVMHTSDRGTRIALFGWGAVFVFAALLLVIAHEPITAAVLAVITAGIGLWLWRGGGGRVVLWVSLLLGLLFVLEQAGYSFADIGGSAATSVADFFGLAAGIVIVTGSILALLGRRRAQQYC
jgi:hypothetical protein